MIYSYLGFFPFWSIVLIALAVIFLLIALIGIVCYLLGCRRPTPEELLAKEFQQLAPDNEFLLSGGAPPMGTGTGAAINDYNDDNQDVPYRSSPFSERTRFGHSNEDTV